MLDPDAVHARLLLGGRLLAYSSKYPGHVEEALLTLRAGRPLYLVGGFQGCARVVTQALLGATPRRRVVDDEVSVVLEPLPGGAPVELTEAYQVEKDPTYAGLIDQYRRTPDGTSGGGTIDYRAVVDELRSRGLAGLNNGLTDEENLRLFTTPFVVEMIQLVLLGFGRLQVEAIRRMKDARPAAPGGGG
jgi:hypothetical protein